VRSVRLLDKYGGGTLYLHEDVEVPAGTTAVTGPKPLERFVRWWFERCNSRGIYGGSHGVAYRLGKKALEKYGTHVLQEMCLFFFRNFREEMEGKEQPFVLFWVLHTRIEKQMKELGSWPQQ